MIKSFERYCTADDARWFFLYQDRDLVTERFAEMIQTDPDDVELKIEWGISNSGDMTGGDIYFGEDHRGHYLTDETLVELAEHMGWRNWVEPYYPPYRMY